MQCLISQCGLDAVTQTGFVFFSVHRILVEPRYHRHGFDSSKRENRVLQFGISLQKSKQFDDGSWAYISRPRKSYRRHLIGHRKSMGYRIVWKASMARLTEVEIRIRICDDARRWRVASTWREFVGAHIAVTDCKSCQVRWEIPSGEVGSQVLKERCHTSKRRVNPTETGANHAIFMGIVFFWVENFH